MLDWLVAAGVPGLAAGCWMLAEGMRRARQAPALLAFLAAWTVNGLFMFDTPGTSIPLFLVLAWLASVSGDVAHGAAGIDEDHPFLDRRVRAGWAERGHRGGNRAIGNERVGP